MRKVECDAMPENTIWINDGLMLVQRRRRCVNVKPAFVQHVVFAGMFRWYK